MWTKTKISETQVLQVGARAADKSQEAIEGELLKAFKKRFEHSLPINAVNLIFIQSEAVNAFLSGASHGGNHEGEMEAHNEE